MLGLEGQGDNGAAHTLSPEVLAAANINPTTRLATDYLNHFNNVVMLLEFIATMPDFIEEIKAWQPVDYPTYFATSHFRERDLAIAAYASTERATRQHFERIIAELDSAVLSAQGLIAACDPSDPIIGMRLTDLVREELQPLIAEASSVINGTCVIAEAVDPHQGNAQDTIDVLFK